MYYKILSGKTKRLIIKYLLLFTDVNSHKCYDRNRRHIARFLIVLLDAHFNFRRFGVICQ